MLVTEEFLGWYAKRPSTPPPSPPPVDRPERPKPPLKLQSPSSPELPADFLDLDQNLLDLGPTQARETELSQNLLRSLEFDEDLYLPDVPDPGTTPSSSRSAKSLHLLLKRPAEGHSGASPQKTVRLAQPEYTPLQDRSRTSFPSTPHQQVQSPSGLGYDERCPLNQRSILTLVPLPGGPVSPSQLRVLGKEPFCKCTKFFFVFLIANIVRCYNDDAVVGGLRP